MQNNLPPAFLQSLEGLQGFDESAFVATHQSGEQVVSIRLNPAKVKSIDQLSFTEAVVSGTVPWNPNGYYLSQRPSFTLDPVFHAGAYYVQEASSMFLAEVLRQTAHLSQPLKVLDLCAAPGGKSTLAQSLISNDSLLISNEVIKTRVNILAENMAKWGSANVIVTNNDPKDFQRLPGYFDIIIVDAPCSGSGLFRKDIAAIDEWSEQNVTMCSQRQQRILEDVLPALKEGGSLVYSTCSYAAIENEAIADWLVADQYLISNPIKIVGDWNIIETRSAVHGAYGYRFYPDKIKGEGFFIAAFKKQGDLEASLQGKYKSKSEKLTAKEIGHLQKYVGETDPFFFIRQKEMVIAMPGHLENDLAAIQFALYIKKAGITLGALIRNELIPDHELAVSTIINRELPFIEVDRETALQYLRRQEFTLAGNDRGWVLLTHRHLPLGWIKMLPNRINNYYPKEWRIFNK